VKILFLLFSSPSTCDGVGLRHFHFIRCLSTRNDVALLSFKDPTEKWDFTPELQEYCSTVISIPLVVPKKLLSYQMVKAIMRITKNIFSLENKSCRISNLLNFYYSPKMQRELREMISTESFDAIYTHPFMGSYVANINLPKIIDFIDALSDFYYQTYKLQGNTLIKMYYLFRYLTVKNQEKRLYKAFDTRIVISPFDKDILESYLPDSNFFVIPQGVDTNYFTKTDIEEDFPSLAFEGNFANPHNGAAIIHFYNNIYPLIQQRIPEVKLYIIGSNAPSEVLKLASDKSVIVTGYVEDIRPYLAKSSIALAPMISGTGVKNKILEAMAMSKPVVSTSMGIHGIDATPEENIIIADEPVEFGNRVVELLNNAKLREKLSCQGRKLVESKYSWERMADMLDELLEKAVKRQPI